MARDWSQSEVRATVEDYFQMLRKDLAGEQFSKADHRRRLSRSLDARTEGAIEFKHENVSGVLCDLGCQFLDGYKPALNYQGLLRVEVERFLKEHREFDALFREDAERTPLPASVEDILGIHEDPPVAKARRGRVGEGRPRGSRAPRDYASIEARNSQLGEAGEKLVIDYETERLRRAGCAELARDIEWVSRSRGDGEGFDVRSFEVDGRQRLLEVKTTSRGPYTPLFISANELEFSRDHREEYFLYRVHSYRRGPRLFTLKGDVGSHFVLDPTEYRASLFGTA